MYKQKDSAEWQRGLLFSLLFILLFSVFFAFDTISVAQQTGPIPCTNYNYSPWTTTCQNGYYTRYVLSGIPSGCVGTASGSFQPETQRSCTVSPLPCTGYTYSAWSTTCQNGYYTRSVLTRTPSGCLETTNGSLSPDIKKICDIPTSTCSFTYSAWGICQFNGMQSRIVITSYPTGCSGGSPITTQSCTNYTNAPICSFTYSTWGPCQSNSMQTRTVTSTSPAGCTGGNPDITRSCTYTQQSGSETSGSGSGQITATTPEFTFLELSSGTTLRGNFTIRGRVDSANTVEFYLIASNSNTPLLVGSAKNADGNYWELSFNTAEKPNGSYYLATKIKNNYGSEPYESNRIQIYINNLSDPVGDIPVSSDLSDAENSASPSVQENTLPKNFNGTTSREWQKKYFGSENCLDGNECRGESDPDNDGLSNSDEFRYRTNPLNPDTDGDGFLDSDEVKNGFNPLQFSPGDRSDKVVFENPKESGEVKKEIYQINNVEMVPYSSDANTTMASPSNISKKGLRLSGKGLPNSFINIYIYSDLPVILTVKTDSDGNWSYILDKQIEDGEHQVYVAVTDNTGKITAKSEPLFFVKTAEAATIIPSAAASALKAASAPAEKRRSRDFIFVVGIIILGFIGALTAIGFYIINTRKKSKGLT